MDKERFNLEKLHKQSPEMDKNAILQKIHNIDESLEVQERRLESTENRSQKTAIEGQIRNLESQLEELKRKLEKAERSEDGAGHA